jgi:hypothetical protein
MDNKMDETLTILGKNGRTTFWQKLWNSSQRSTILAQSNGLDKRYANRQTEGHYGHDSDAWGLDQKG